MTKQNRTVSGTADISDAVNTLADAIASVAVFTFMELVEAGLVTNQQAGSRLRLLAKHMRSPEHTAPVIGEGVALKLEDFALVLESVNEPGN